MKYQFIWYNISRSEESIFLPFIILGAMGKVSVYLSGTLSGGIRKFFIFIWHNVGRSD
jgi:hypothetical protein